MKTRISIVIAALFAAFISTANAGPQNPLWPDWESRLGNRVATAKAAEDCCKEPGVKVALVCKDCKSVSAKGGEEKAGIMGWFKPDSMHDCSGCKGKIKFSAPTTKGSRAAEYTHTCSKCGENSALICSSHKK